jgi:hypothetical protein
LSFDDHGSDAIEELKMNPIPKSIAFIAESKDQYDAIVSTAPRVPGPTHVV